jgi:hypothetical protein
VSLASLAGSLPFEVDLARTQDLYWELLRDTYPGRREASDETSRAWCAAFERLGAELSVSVPTTTDAAAAASDVPEATGA